MLTEHMVSQTLTKDSSAILIIVPKSKLKHEVNESCYDEDAERMYQFLLKVFCNKTLQKLSRKITCGEAQ